MAGRIIKQLFNFRKLMINVILLLSITAFSGIHCSYPSGNQQKTKSELRHAYLSLVKKSIAYHASKRLYGKVFFINKHGLNHAILVYNNSLKTKLNLLSCETLPFGLKPKFSFKSSVHQYADEDFDGSV